MALALASEAGAAARPGRASSPGPVTTSHYPHDRDILSASKAKQAFTADVRLEADHPVGTVRLTLHRPDEERPLDLLNKSNRGRNDSLQFSHYTTT